MGAVVVEDELDESDNAAEEESLSATVAALLAELVKIHKTMIGRSSS